MTRARMIQEIRDLKKEISELSSEVHRLMGAMEVIRTGIIPNMVFRSVTDQPESKAVKG